MGYKLLISIGEGENASQNIYDAIKRTWFYICTSNVSYWKAEKKGYNKS